MLREQSPIDGLAQQRKAGVDLHPGGHQTPGVPPGQRHRRRQVITRPISRVQARVGRTRIGGAGIARLLAGA
ncbi:hypothetical protein GCM10009570_23140 [Dietzia natronolimnaea]